MSSDWSAFLQAQADRRTHGLGITTMQACPLPSTISIPHTSPKPSLKRYHSDVEDQVETSKQIRSRLSMCPPVRRASTAHASDAPWVAVSERASVASVDMDGESAPVGEEQLCSGIIAPRDRGGDNQLPRGPGRDPAQMHDPPVMDHSPFDPHMDAWLAWRGKRMSMAMDADDDFPSRASTCRLRQVSRVDPFACVMSAMTPQPHNFG